MVELVLTGNLESQKDFPSSSVYKNDFTTKVEDDRQTVVLNFDRTYVLYIYVSCQFYVNKICKYIRTLSMYIYIYTMYISHLYINNSLQKTRIVTRLQHRMVYKLFCAQI